MSQSWLKYNAFYTLAFFLILSFIIMILYGQCTGPGEVLNRIALEVFEPFHILASYTVNWFQNIWDGYIFLLTVKRENLKLKEYIAELEAINMRFLEIEKENERLKELLEFREKLPTAIISAQIIGKDATSWFRSTILDKGTKDGVCVNQPVVTNKGIVGKVVRTTSSASMVELITDKNSRVAAMIQKNRAEAILCGQSGPICTLEYLARDVDIQIGDSVISSGMGGIFPKGLMLGIISKIEKAEKESYGLFQYAEVAPQVPFSKLEDVLILKSQDDRVIPSGSEIPMSLRLTKGDENQPFRHSGEGRNP
ncbi:rod shape-determining protein MreC [bacterium]|nr:rod shape-determining protein MreC [bacterium]